MATISPIDNYKFGFDTAFLDAILDRRSQNDDIFTRILDDTAFASAVKAALLAKVYERQHASGTPPPSR